MKQEKWDFYEEPQVEVLDIISEGVICGSGPVEPGENEGIGDEGDLN